MWEPVRIDGLLGTVKAVCPPAFNASLFVFTDRGLFAVHLDRDRKAEQIHGLRYALPRFDAEAGTFTRPETPPVYGHCGEDDTLYTPPLTTTHPHGQTLARERGTLRILSAAGATELTLDDAPPNAAWSATAFSACGRYFLAASPGRVLAFRYLPLEGKAAPVARGVQDRAAFLEAIRAAPDDDMPRLVFADWLEENGDLARAEFIRLQCERHRHDPMNLRQDTNPDWPREYELLHLHRDRWIAELGIARGVRWSGFHRGLPILQTDSIRGLISVWPKSQACSPVEWAILVMLNASDLTRLLASAVFDSLRVLELQYANGMDEGARRQFLHSPRLANLCGLCLPQSNVNWLANLVGSADLTRLEWLNAERLRFMPEKAAIDLAASNAFPALRHVAWPSGQKFPPKTAAILAKRFPK